MVSDNRVGLACYNSTSVYSGPNGAHTVVKCPISGVVNCNRGILIIVVIRCATLWRPVSNYIRYPSPRVSGH